MSLPEYIVVKRIGSNLCFCYLTQAESSTGLSGYSGWSPKMSDDIYNVKVSNMANLDSYLPWFIINSQISKLILDATF